MRKKFLYILRILSLWLFLLIFHFSGQLDSRRSFLCHFSVSPSFFSDSFSVYFSSLSFFHNWRRLLSFSLINELRTRFTNQREEKQYRKFCDFRESSWIDIVIRGSFNWPILLKKLQIQLLLPLNLFLDLLPIFLGIWKNDSHRTFHPKSGPTSSSISKSNMVSFRLVLFDTFSFLSHLFSLVSTPFSWFLSQIFNMKNPAVKSDVHFNFFIHFFIHFHIQSQMPFLLNTFCFCWLLKVLFWNISPHFFISEVARIIFLWLQLINILFSCLEKMWNIVT